MGGVSYKDFRGFGRGGLVVAALAVAFTLPASADPILTSSGNLAFPTPGGSGCTAAQTCTISGGTVLTYYKTSGANQGPASESTLTATGVSIPVPGPSGTIEVGSLIWAQGTTNVNPDVNYTLSIAGAPVVTLELDLTIVQSSSTQAIIKGLMVDPTTNLLLLGPVTTDIGGGALLTLSNFSFTDSSDNLGSLETHNTNSHGANYGNTWWLNPNSNTDTLTITANYSVPEPSSLQILVTVLLGLIGFVAFRHRKAIAL